jgi:hypothetical protein
MSPAPKTDKMTIDEIMRLSPVIPVLVIEDIAHAVPLGRALVAGGLPVLEITLRTPVAMACIERMAGEIEGAVVGAGTVLSAEMRRAAAGVGARFCVSPGLIEGATPDGPAPLLPGIATATELMAQAVPGQRRRRRRRPEGLRQSLPAGEVLPHRRRQRRKCSPLSGPAKCDLRRRQLGRARRGREGRRLGPHYRTRAGSRGAGESLTCG